MKGVIVQVGEPKSIVLFNNGKISAIPTPSDCHVGMVVTVKFNNKFKITVITLAAVLLVGLGVFIGVFARKNYAALSGGSGRTLTVAEVKKFPDDTPVALTGTIVRFLGDAKYVFGDATGEITVKVSKKAGRDFSVGDTVTITGEVEIKKQGAVIDIKTIRSRSAP